MPRDFRVYVGFSKHRKRLALKARLGPAGPLALLDLWEFATAHRPRGTLDYLTDLEVEREAGWEGQQGELVAALIDLNWASRNGHGWLSLHGWKEKQPHAYNIEELAEKARMAGKASATKRSTTRSTECSTDRSPFTLSPSPLPDPPTEKQKPLRQQQNADGPVYTAGFLKFWGENGSGYPRKVGKGAAWKAWVRSRCEPLTERITASVEACRDTEQWRKDGGKFIPHPATYLNERRWEDEQGISEKPWVPGESGIIQGVMRTLYGGKRE